MGPPPRKPDEPKSEPTDSTERNRIMKYAITTSASILALGIAAPAIAQSNTSTVDQSGINGQATVTQTGSGNDSDITQSNTPIGGAPNIANVATVTQAGTDGVSSIDQTGDNTATVNQTAASDGMNSVIEQSTTVGGNQARVTQRGLGSGESTTIGSFITQTGRSGNTRVQQNEGTVDAVSRVTQNGTGNQRIEVIQESGTASSIIIQNGGSFQTEVYQDGSNFSDINQSGTNSTAAVRQEGGDSNVSNIVQTGTNAEAGDPISDPNDAPLGITDGELGVWQNGNGNESDVFQYGTNQVVDVFQFGDGNISSITQEASGREVLADVLQDGNGNESTIEQSGLSTAAAGLGNKAFVDQIGDGNVSFVYQDDDTASFLNTANVDQLGDSGESTVTQTGNTNTANLTQADLTDGNISFITQGGNNNTANVFQTSSDNTSTVTQSGTDGTVNVTQGPPPAP